MIILVRHGETEANRRRCFADSNKIPLNETGRMQAQKLATRLAREFRPELLFSSDFARARETSEIIGGVLGLETEVIAGIHERDFGRLKGLPYEQMQGDVAHDGESLEDVQLRAAPVLEALRTEHTGRQVIVVCHGAVIQAMCAHITGEWNHAWVPPNCGIVVIDYVGQQWKQPVVSGDWERL